MSQFLPVDFVVRDYQIVQRLGQGGFAITYVARHLDTGELRCLKESFTSEFHLRAQDHSVGVIGDKYQADVEEINSRFKQEAQSLSKIDHTNVVKVHDVFDANGTSYIAMEYVQGETLKQLVLRLKSKDKGLGANQLRYIFLKLAKALRHVHHAGMLHQDISPDNVLIRPNTEPVLIDFGSVSRMELQASTQSRLFIVKDGYSPPELYDRRVMPTKASDVYSLGATMIFAITGKKPMDAIARKSNADPVTKSLPLWVCNLRWDAPLENTMVLDPRQRIDDLDPLIQALEGPPPSSPQKPRWLLMAVTALVFMGLAGAWLWGTRDQVMERKVALFLGSLPEIDDDEVATHLSVWPTADGAYLSQAAKVDTALFEGWHHAQMLSVERAGLLSWKYKREILLGDSSEAETALVEGELHFNMAMKIHGWQEENPMFKERMQEP